MHHKMAFDPAIINMSLLVGIKRIYGNTTSTLRDKFMPFYLIDQDPASQELIWEIKPLTDAMLRASVNASESCIEPSHLSTWLHVKGRETVHELFVMEPTNHILEWLRMDNDTAMKIEEICPSWIFGKDLKIYYTSMAPDANATT